MPAAEIIVLARSKKLGGLCVAGICAQTGRWVRPVSDLEHGQLVRAHYDIDGKPPDLLDVVRIQYLEELENPAQPENVLLDDEPWKRVATIGLDEAYQCLAGSLVEGPALLGNRGKAVPENESTKGVAASLALVEPDEPVEFVMRPPAETYGRLKPRAVFHLSGHRYELGLTDLKVERQVLKAGVGEYTAGQLGFGEPGRTLLTVSLGEAHDGWNTKLAAAVLFLP